MRDFDTEQFILEDGSRIAIVGGGPAGSFFAYYALDFADRLGMEIRIDIFEAKDFLCTGPKGCNHCGGIVSESLIQTLSTEGVVMPSEVIRRGIESYTLHLEQGSSVIETPLNEQRIAAMFRGLGPLGAEKNGMQSFDNHLLDLCKNLGAQVIEERVTGAIRTADAVTLTTKSGGKYKYDLLVGAVGLNAKTLELFESICSSFRPPETTKTFISEFKLDPDVIQTRFGNSMHVFLLNLPHIKFGALIPKGSYITLVLLGNNINKEIASVFLNSGPVRKLFPEGTNLDKITPCKCFPSINIKGAKFAYDDRVVLVGDSASSKLYKNGIGAAYITGKAAANTAIFHGISASAFKKHYQPVCTGLDRDNSLGKFIFSVTTIIQKSAILKGGMLRLVIHEQNQIRQKRRMSSVLWDTFTGSATYSNIFLRVLHPSLLLNFFRFIFISMFNITFKKNEKQQIRTTLS
jgi:flavin-dependent dehydrogenase